MRKVLGRTAVATQQRRVHIKATLHNALYRTVKTVIKTVYSEKLEKSKGKKTSHSIKKKKKKGQTDTERYISNVLP